MREVMEFDVVIIGAGPAGLSAAIRLAQLAKQQQVVLNICVLEKSATLGAHIISGAVLDPYALNELIPDWQTQNPPAYTPVTQDKFLLLTEKKSWRLPTPAPMHNAGNYIISLSQFCRWLGAYAESLGVNIFPGFAATEIIYENDKVIGVLTGDKGISKEGKQTEHFQPGIALHAKQTIFAEGSRGFLTQQLFQRYQLRANVQPQTYALGIKEVWEINPKNHQAGLVIHSIGWPLDNKTYGGSFVYHWENNKVVLGFVVGLDYQNPYLNLYEELQRFKTHPDIAPMLLAGHRIAYGARALNEGGLQAIPKLIFPGGLLVGCGAGLLNVPKIKGIHNAMKSGMLAAENLFPLLQKNNSSECSDYPKALRQSSVWSELQQVRNIRPAFRWGLWPGLCYAAIDHYLLRGKAPWTFKIFPDHEQLKKAAECQPITYPAHDNKLTFDLMSSVFLANMHYEENQPCHLKLKNPEVAISVNLKYYAAPEQRYCPAGVYEIVNLKNNQPYLQINAGNCVQCKACDIKDPTQNITWTPPEGGDGPNYTEL